MTSGSVDCVVHYNQAGNDDYEAATEVTETAEAESVPPELIDTTPPAVTITENPANPTSSTAATFTFTATDDESGIASVTCKLDGAAAAPCTSPKSYSGLSAGSHTFTVKAIDNASNMTSKSYSWVVDVAGPALGLISKPPANSNSTSASFAFTATDPAGVATTECKLDGAAFVACSSPMSYSSLGEGPHTVKVRATDTVGNATTVSYTWSIDATAPVVAITTKPPLFTNQTSAQFAFTATDANLLSVTCAVDGGPFVACTSPRTVNSLSHGSHTFRVRAEDKSGNATIASYSWTADVVAPVISLTGKPASTTNKKTATFSFTVTDASSGVASVQCKLDSGAWAACTSPKSYSGLAAGTHKFQVKATDNAGNISTSTFSWTVIP
jgi:hypothetical protein